MAGRSPIPHPKEWPVVRLGDITTKIGSGATPTGGEDSYLPERARFALIRSQNVYDRHFDPSGLAFISDEQANRLQGVAVKPKDLLLNITGDGITFSRACLVPVEVLPACVNQHVAIVRVDELVADAGYVLSYLTHPAVKPYIESFNAGGSRRAITKGHIESFQIPLPPLSDQRAIAHILGTLDDKIELNRRMNETLEAIARALFKSWFVDFEPVQRNIERRKRGQTSPAASCPPLPLGEGRGEGVIEGAAFDHLFPDSFVDSELGEIPEGWWVRTLADFAVLNPETWSKDTRPDAINYVDLSNTKWGRIETVTTYACQDAPSRAQRVLRPRDTIVGTVRPGNGSYAFITEDGLTGSTGFAVLRPRRSDCAEFTYLAATAVENIEALSHLADGGAYPAIRPEVVAATQVIRPDDKVLAEFAKRVAPLLAKMAMNERESRTLAALRDALLPKLISGEVRVKNPEVILEETVLLQKR